jgi:hypothetical protein
VHCDECGYDYDALTRPEIAPALRTDTSALRRTFERVPEGRVRTRPAPDVWSPLEYACHVRDVLEVQRERLLLVRSEENPRFVPMGREERVVDRRYNEQDTAVVAEELGAAAEALAATLDASTLRAGPAPACTTTPSPPTARSSGSPATRCTRSATTTGTSAPRPLDHGAGRISTKPRHPAVAIRVFPPRMRGKGALSVVFHRLRERDGMARGGRRRAQVQAEVHAALAEFAAAVEVRLHEELDRSWRTQVALSRPPHSAPT